MKTSERVSNTSTSRKATIGLGIAGITLAGAHLGLSLLRPHTEVTTPVACAEAQVDSEAGVGTPIQLGALLINNAGIEGKDATAWGDVIASLPGDIQDGEAYAAVIQQSGSVSIQKGNCPEGLPTPTAQ